MGIKFDSDFVFKLIMFYTFINLIGGITLFSEKNLNVSLIILIIILIYSFKFKKLRSHKLLLESATCYIEFEHDNKKYQLKALIDTGHHVKTFYDEDIIFVRNNLFYTGGGGKKNHRIVRYKTVSGNEENIGTKIYNVKIRYSEKSIYNNAVIVSTPNILNQFDAIIGLSLIEGGWTNGNIDFNKTESKEIIP